MRAASSVLDAAPERARANDRAFYTGMAVAAALAVLLGFSRTYYLRPYFQTTPLATAFRVHGFVFSAWIALFVAQTSLVAARRTAIHRKLGWAGACLAVLMIVVALNAAMHGAQRDIAAGYEEQALSFFTTPVLSMVMFATLVALAVASRGRPETHKRLMLLATLSLLDAATARWPIPGIQDPPFRYYAAADAFIAAAVLYDFASRRAISPVYVFGGLAIVAEQWARDALGATAVWQAFAARVLE
ncbi:MAG TPA: hypothetical protein VMU03_03680 [Gammaproteobacteria bacterium]|nr:hypothetical protein [Gammaproteobacteria bacterium]